MSTAITTAFPDHTLATAPPAAHRTLAAVEKQWGFIPSGAARLATSPHTLDGFLKIGAIFENSTLDPVAREALIMTMATRNGCHICTAIHTKRLTLLEADPAVIEALRAGATLPDERLEALRQFTLHVLETSGDVGDQALTGFFSHGFTAQNALEVVLGIGAYTLSTLANRLTGAPLDPQLAEYA
jgi:AhpD family alkylhydroperoxidase